MSNEIKKLSEGYKQFKNKFFGLKIGLFNKLANGQNPKNLIIACSDSRVDPAIIFNCKPGELFVIRIMANLVPPFEIDDSYHGVSATLEFGTRFLEIENIIIFGHTQCGGIRALIESHDKILNKKENQFISKWMDLARPAYDKIINENEKISLEDKIILCEKYSLINSLNNLQTFSWIKKRVESGKLFLHAWYFDLESGLVYMYDQKEKNWKILEQ